MQYLERHLLPLSLTLSIWIQQLAFNFPKIQIDVQVIKKILKAKSCFQCKGLFMGADIHQFADHLWFFGTFEKLESDNFGLWQKQKQNKTINGWQLF